MFICLVDSSYPVKSVGAEGKVAKKFALYPPKSMVKELGLKEGQKVRYNVENGKLLVEPLPNPIELAKRTKKWARISTKELEAESEREQREMYA